MIYTFGYQRQRPTVLLALAVEKEAIVIDIRLRPYSRAKGWSRGQLVDLLGDRYLWVADFGNLNYQGGPVQLKDPEEGIEKLREEGILPERNVILLCYEERPEDCHRTSTAELLSDAFDVPVEHILRPDLDQQPRLL